MAAWGELFVWAVFFHMGALATDVATVDFADAQSVITEGETAHIQVRREGDLSQPVSVVLQLESGDAEGFPVTLRFERGEVEKVMLLPTENNPIPEFDREFDFVLTNYVGAAMGQISRTQVRVIDDDGRPGSVKNQDGAQFQIDESWVDFWTNSTRNVGIAAMIAAPNGGAYVVAGKEDLVADEFIAFDKNGALDRSCPHFSAPVAGTLAMQSDGKLLLAGHMREIQGHAVNSIARYTASGQFDETFRYGNYSAHGIVAVVVQPDDKIVIGGLILDSPILRLFKDGGVDPSFSVPTREFRFIFRMALQPDGKIVFAYLGDLGQPWIARVNANGSVDATFQRVAATDSDARGLALQADGKILFSFGTDVHRVTSTGAIDENFKLGSGADGPVKDIVVLPDAKILVAGFFKHMGGFERHGLARLNADGSVDAAFDPGAGGDTARVILLNDGDYFVGGAFPTYNSLPIKALAKVRASVTPRFLLWTKPDGIETWFAGNPGSRVVFDQSSDLENWEPLETRTLETFLTKITPQLRPVGFIRAQVN